MSIALPTRALSLWAPWVWAILHCGKDIENRRLSFPKSFQGEFWLHASLWPGTRKPLNVKQNHTLVAEIDSVVDRANSRLEQVRQFDPRILGQIDAMRGKIIGRVTVTRYVRSSDSVWYVPGALGLELANPIALARHVPAVGLQGWWNVKPETLAELARAA